MEVSATRYRQHLAGLLRLHPPVPALVEGQVGLGYAAPLAALVSGAAMPQIEAPQVAPVADSFGHRRPAYRGLLLHAWGRALLRGWRPAREDRLPQWYAEVAKGFVAELPQGALPAAQGFDLCRQAWEALALYSGGLALREPKWRLTGETFFSLLRGRVQRETFMRVQADDNLEPWWYHELVLLHAATSYALARQDEAWLAFLDAAAGHHYRETQPDHASTQPWGINAFLRFENTAFLADQMIHSAVTQGEGKPESVAAILFADALDQ